MSVLYWDSDVILLFVHHRLTMDKHYDVASACEYLLYNGVKQSTY
jgi:hypothetical protein